AWLAALLLSFHQPTRMTPSFFWVLWISGNRFKQCYEIRSFDLSRSGIQQPVDHREIELHRLSLHRADQAWLIVRQPFQSVQNAPEHPIAVRLRKALKDPKQRIDSTFRMWRFEQILECLIQSVEAFFVIDRLDSIDSGNNVVDLAHDVAFILCSRCTNMFGRDNYTALGRVQG